MTWLLTWFNVSVAKLNATLQLLVIYRFDDVVITFLSISLCVVSFLS